MKTKTIKITQSEMWQLEELYPECAAWRFDVKEFLENQALAYELDDQYIASGFENNLYVDIDTAHTEGYDVVKYEVNDEASHTGGNQL